MAGEVMVINPRRRRRRARKARSSHRRRSPRRRRRHLYALNPRRRRRSHRRRAVARRRRHSNPRLGGLGLGSVTSGLKTGLGIGIGVAVTEIGVKAAVKFIPGIPAQLQTGLGLSALKIGVGAVALPFVLKMVGQRKLASDVAIGAWVAVTADLIAEYVTPHLGLGDYTMEDYTMGDQLQPDQVLGADENMYSNTMYGYGY